MNEVAEHALVNQRGMIASGALSETQHSQATQQLRTREEDERRHPAETNIFIKL